MEQRDIVVVGGGPSGLAAAIFAKLDGWSTLVLEANWVGGQATIASTVTNYPGFLPGDGAILMDNLEKQVTLPPPAGVGAEVRQEKVVSINADRTITTETNRYQSKTIIMATGSTMQKLGVPGEEELVGRGVSYYAKRDSDKFAGKRVLVIGGGNSTAKSALGAKEKASEVTLVHRRESLRAYPAMLKRLEKEGVQITYNTEVKRMNGGDRVKEAVLVNNKTGQEKRVPVDWIVICVGTEPNSELARQVGLETSGNIVKVNGQMMTTQEGIFACGEIAGSDRHLISAAASGAYAGMAASQYLALQKVKAGERFEGSINGKYADEYQAMLK